jgi:hypothetical protein
MITAALQMFVFVASAFCFAGYVLKRDKRENPPQAKPEDAQRSIQFPTVEADEEHEHQGAAMSRL